MIIPRALACLAVSIFTSSCALEIEDWWGDEDEDVGGAAENLVGVHPGETGEAELAGFLPVARREGDAERRVVMRLGPGELPDLRTGDRLITPAEVEVTTRCDIGQNAPGCNYNPHIAAQLILTGRRDDVRASGDGSVAFSDVAQITCTKAEHHCKIVFTPRQANHRLTGRYDLPCVRDDSCHVNLVMWAWHGDARSGGQDRVIVGENEGNFLQHEAAGHAERGRDGDKGRLMAVRERGVRPADRDRSRTSGSGSRRVPTNASSVLIYSHRIGRDLRAGENFVIEAKVVAAVSDRARFSTLMFVTKDPRATSAGSVTNKIFPSQITEHNGINCTRGTSPCTTRRVAVFRVTEDIRGPVYVNLIARSAVPGGGSANVTVRRGDGWIRSTRYVQNSATARSAPAVEPDAGTAGPCGADVAACVDDLGLTRCEGDLGIMQCGDGPEIQRCTCMPGGFDACAPCETR